MIQAKDLRVGNWIIYNGIQIQVDAIMNNEDNRVFMSGGMSVWGKCTPIQLTPDILVKCGFIWNNELDGYELNGWFPFIIGKVTIVTEKYFLTTFERDWVLGEKFIYVHQLQNLYFALTQTELTITL